MTSTDQNKAIVRRYYEDILNQKKLAMFQEIFDPAFVSHVPGGTVTVPLDRYKQLVQESHTTFPDLHVTIDDQIAEGDKVVTRWTSHMTHLAPMMGIPPTGKALTITGIHIHRLAKGKLGFIQKMKRGIGGEAPNLSRGRSKTHRRLRQRGLCPL